MTNTVAQSIAALPDSGSSRHGGNLRQLAQRAGRRVEELLDFSASINPLGPPEWLRCVISRHVEQLVHYPEPDAGELLEALAEHLRGVTGCLLAGNGSTEILYALPRVLERRRALIPVPCYVDYATAASAAGLDIQPLPLNEAFGFAVDWPQLAGELRGDEIVLLGQPNNPTGRLFDAQHLCRLAGNHPQSRFVIDEAFADFVPDYRSVIRDRPSNVIVVRSLTKFYAIPGLRLGFVVADPAIIQSLRLQIPPWSVNGLAQAVGKSLLGDTEYAQRTRKLITELRQGLAAQLAALPGLHVYPGSANYLLLRLEREGLDAVQIAEELLVRHGIALRTCETFPGLDRRFVRIAVRTAEENKRLVAAMADALRDRSIPRQEQAATPPSKRRAATIMFQGTSSNAGKSVLTTALCRILLQDGLRVAPFKAQNMSLNSFVTRAGGEMGRAQVVQAQACRLEPDVRMNPLLLKPNSDTGSQIILCGKPVRNMNFTEYNRYKPEARRRVHECFDALADEFDAVVIEGAGSPGEVNLKRQDIVNMAMARHAQAPVLLVGDIDRGGVYASFVGTMEVLAEWERKLLAGFVVNRFRGDASLLGPAHDYVLAHTGRPVLGVVPYLSDLQVPSEDSVDFKSGTGEPSRGGNTCVDLAVIDLPHISNFTDLDALRIESDVALRVVRSPAELGKPDALIIPGSKNTIGDLLHLERIGLVSAIRSLATSASTEIVGICGGYQMLGTRILDPHHLESAQDRLPGLGLLPLETVLAQEKTLTRAQAAHLPSGLTVQGYEIHHGQTDTGDAVPLFQNLDGQALGARSTDGRVWGTYLHGIFDADPFRRWFIDQLRTRKGLPALGAVQAVFDLEPALDRLANAVRESLDMKAVYRLMGL